MTVNHRKLGLVLLAVAIAVLSLVLLAGRHSPSSERVSSEHSSAAAARVPKRENQRTRIDLGAAVEGKVVDTDDVAIAGAQVCVGPASPVFMAELDPYSHCVIADDAGRFEISVAPGRTRLSASARGFIPPPIVRGRVGLITTVAAGEVRSGLVLRLRRGGAEVRGTVIDITGGTVAGARVFSETNLTLSDDEGRFSLWLDARSFVELQVRADGYAHASITEWRPAGRELEILLRPEVVLVGRVITADTGQAVADVAVLANVSRFGGAPVGELQTRTDADGRFQFTGLRPGRYKPEVRSGNFRGAARESVLLTLGVESDEVVIQVHPARKLEGRVVEAGSREGCEFGMVTIHDASGAVIERASADSSGAIAVGGLLPGPHSLTIVCDEVTPSTHATVDLTEHDVVGVEWEVERLRGRAIRGRVLDASGRGVAMVRVVGELRDPDDPGTQATGVGVTEADGTFELLDLPPGVYAFTRVEAEGMAAPNEYPKVTLARDRDTNDVEIVLPDAGALRILVRDESGAAVPDAEIFVGKGKGGTVWKSVPNSEWLIAPCSPATYYVRVLRPGIGGRAGPDDPSSGRQGVPVEVITGETAELILTAPARNEVIAGIVRTVEGEPVVDAAVWALSSETFIDLGGRQVNPEVARTTTDIDGRFMLDHLEAGTHAVHTRSQAGIEQAREGVASGTTNVEFELPRAGSVAGRIEVGNGEPPPSLFTISITPVDGRRGRSEEFLFTRGEWRIVGLPPGEVTIEVSAAEGTSSTTVTIREGEERNGVVLELAPRGAVRGRVVDAETGEPVPGYYATATSASRGAQAAVLDPDGKRYTDADGWFELQQVPSGEVMVRLWSSRGLSRSYRDIDRRFTVEAGGMTNVGTIEASRRQAN